MRIQSESCLLWANYKRILQGYIIFRGSALDKAVKGQKGGCSQQTCAKLTLLSARAGGPTGQYQRTGPNSAAATRDVASPRGCRPGPQSEEPECAGRRDGWAGLGKPEVVGPGATASCGILPTWLK